MLATGNFELKYYCSFLLSVLIQPAEYEVAAGKIISKAAFTSFLLVVDLYT